MGEQTTPSKKISVGLILSWIFGVLFALTGIISVFSEPIPGLVMLIMAAVLLPPVTKLVDQKWKFHLSSGMKIVVIIIGLIIYGATVDTSNVSTTQQDEPQKEEQQATQNEDVVDETATTEQVNEEQPQTETNEQVANEEKTETIPTSDEEEKPTPTKDSTIPTEYKSALNKATSYANTQHMSKQGLYDQLVSEYGEQFSAEAAQYAIDNVAADWNANALAKAKSYQETQNMSPAAIHDQLVSEYGEQFTKAEADYAIQHLND